MKCFVCETAGVDKSAVATCPTCGVGLCLDHRRSQAVGAGGTAIECRHDINRTPSAPR